VRQVAETLELAGAPAEVSVLPEEYVRLLGYPRGWVLEGRARELADWARVWYAENGRPWVYARQAESFALAGDSIRIDGVTFTSKRLGNTLQQAEAHSVILVAVGAGPEVEEEARRRWADEKPDEYFFLEIFGSAVVEHLTTVTGARLCAQAEQQGMAVLPHYSPGYPEWDVAEQAPLLELLQRTRNEAFPSRVDALESGMLRPKKTLLAVFGLTRHADRLGRLADLVPCESCSFGPCQYRRAPYRRAPRSNGEQVVPRIPMLDQDDRDGSVDAVFRYEGTTCTNMGRPMAFDYNVKLGPRGEGYPIREQRCAPAPGDTGHAHMCQYIENPSRLMDAIDSERPLNGERLNAVVSWRRTASGAGCYCESASRDHKWGLVLETIHYALAQKELEEDSEP